MSNADLYYRIADALGGHDVRPEDASTIQQAFLAAGDDGTWADLDPAVQKLVEEIEGRPAQTWDDPSQVPGNAPLEG